MSAIRDAASAFEAHFLRQLLTEARGSSGEALFGGGFAGSTFREMLDGALADSIAASGGMGLQDVIAQSLGEAADPQSSVHKASVHPITAPLRAQQSYISSGFGPRTDPIDGAHREHHGIDIAAPQGTAVRAVRPGVVVRAEEAEGYGNLVVIDHGDGLETRYAHLDSIAVRAGDPIRDGETLGEVGDTGRATGAHLHFEARRHGKPFDPAAFIQGLKRSR